MDQHALLAACINAVCPTGVVSVNLLETPENQKARRVSYYREVVACAFTLYELVLGEIIERGW